MKKKQQKRTITNIIGKPLTLQIVVSRLWLGVLVSAILLSPWVMWPFYRVAYEVPRVYFWQLVSWLLVGLTLIQLFLSKRQPVTSQMVRVAWLAWLGVVLAATLINQGQGRAWQGNFYRVDGVSTILAMGGLAFAVSQSWQPAWRLIVVKVSTLSATAIALWALADVGRKWLFADAGVPLIEGAAGISFGHPNFLAGYLLMSLPLALYWWRLIEAPRSKGVIARWWFYFCQLPTLAILVLFGTVLSTQSLGAILGLGVLLSCQFLLVHKKFSLIPGLVVLAAVIFMGVALWHGSSHYQPESRYRIVRRLSAAIAEKPLLGWGVAQVDTALAAHPWPKAVLHDVYIDKAHSHLLESLTTTGLIGLSVYLLFVGSVWVVLFHRVRNTTGYEQWWWQTLFVLVGLYFYHTQTNVIGIAEEVPFWIVVGWALLPAKGKEDRQK